MIEDITIEEPQEYKVVLDTYLLPVLRKRIEKANNRLAKAGIAERFELIVSDARETFRFDEDLARTVYRAVADVELAVPSIGYNGWTFVATLVFEQGGTVVRTVPGETCSYRPTDKVCDHCGTARERKETFVVRNADGEFKQVGRNCLALFFGLKPNLWVYDVTLAVGDDEREAASTNRGVAYESVEQIVAAALAATNGGQGYVSKANAEARNCPSTSDVVYNVLYGKYESETGRNAQYAREENAKLRTRREARDAYLADGTRTAEVIEAAKAITGNSEYAENIRVLAASEFVTVKNIGFVASFVSVWNRGREEAVKTQAKAASPVSNWIAKEGEKKVTTTGTVTFIREIEGDYGTSLLVEWTTADGDVCKWFTSGWYSWQENGCFGVGLNGKPEGTPIELGTVLTIEGTVKRHEERQGRKATVFTRCKVVASVPFAQSEVAA